MPDALAVSDPSTPRHWRLSHRQYNFAQLVFKGVALGPAYLQAGYTPPAGIKSAYEAASRLSRNVKVTRYLGHLAALAKRTARHATLARQRKRELLCDCAEDAEKWADRLNAIIIDNRMTGDDAPIRLEGEITLKGILDGIAPSVGLPPAADPADAASIIEVDAEVTGPTG